MNVEISEVANLPTKFGDFKIQAFKELLSNGCFKEHLAIFTDPIPETPVVRVHSECLTGDALGSRKCDCGEQLEFALHMIQSQGGMVIYLRQEGRNIGLLNKVNAYALQDRGLDTVAANHQLGFSADERTYEMVETILAHFEIEKIRLLTNNPKKIESLEGIEIVERLPIIVEANPHNITYLQTKKEKMGHLF
ncbi:GTP cyclohydrolase II [Hydrogenimonas cancrithermarum]|uniref:GTP cyclohydrolase-2 n=1 Tax=Hydrogenimonas cancrithermarum TaxID=2993563 RepID=A0ABN6WUJ2_9BACT|nr:GTP cyclohydrolase II [Hydrogenimonas cancrithermarum]BDY12641.1 GTP cyclohydrolase-2 [Hydrogenimonas cancrithermarum]